jgi:hypothetical protein
MYIFNSQAAKHGQVNYVFPKPKAFTSKCMYCSRRHIELRLVYSQFKKGCPLQTLNSKRAKLRFRVCKGQPFLNSLYGDCSYSLVQRLKNSKRLMYHHLANGTRSHITRSRKLGIYLF